MERQNSAVTELFRSIDRVRRAWRDITPCKPLTKSQFGTLLCISRLSAENNGKNIDSDSSVVMSELACAMRQSLPALSQRVKVLEDEGFIERVPYAQDRRVSAIKLTQSGISATFDSQKRFERIFSYTMRELGDDAGRLVSLLTRLAEIFENASQHIGEEGAL